MKLLFLTSLLSILPTASQSLSAHCATPQIKADSVTTSKRHANVESTREGRRSRYRAQGYRIQVFTETIVPQNSQRKIWRLKCSVTFLNFLFTSISNLPDGSAELAISYLEKKLNTM